MKNLFTLILTYLKKGWCNPTLFSSLFINPSVLKGVEGRLANFIALKFKMIVIFNLIKNHFFNNEAAGAETSNVRYRSSFVLPLVLSLLGKEIEPELIPLVKYSITVLCLTIIAIASFVSICGYLLSIYLVSKYEIESKFSSYPRLVKMIKLNQNMSTLFIFYEAALVLFCLLALASVSLYISGIVIFT